MSAARARVSEQPTTAWKIRNSLWVFMCVGTFGLAAPWIILYVAVASRRPAWMAFGAGLAAASITSMVWLSGAAIWQREASDWLLMAVWLGGSAFAAGTNREYLRIKWAARKDVNAAFPASASAPARRTRGGAAKASRNGSPAASRKRGRPHSDSASSSPPASTSRPAAVSVPALVQKKAPSSSDTSRGGAGVSAGLNGNLRARTTSGVGAESDVVEVNGASVDDFAALPGFDADLAARAVSLRQGRPYVSVEQFAERLALQPHVFVRIRSRLSCRPASVPPGFGRRVDY